MTKKQVGEERVYLAYTSALLFMTEGGQDRRAVYPEAESDAEAMERCYLLADFPRIVQCTFL